jgi:FkbM family methyltransferase
MADSSWLLKKTKGATLFDKFILKSLKATYLSARIFLRIVLGSKERRDRFYIKRGINFRDFLYNSVERLRLDKTLMIVFNAPKYNYRFYGRITRKVQNFLIEDIYASMTCHEDEIVEQFRPKEGDIVDIGAAFGFYTILSSRRIGLNGKVVAIEAQPDSFEMLNRNIKLNELANVITLGYAVYSKNSRLKLYDNYSIMQERAGKDLQQYIEVNAYTLDYLLFELIKITRVNWIKIDVEGAELEVLKGARNILSNSNDIRILIEIHGQENYKQVTEFLISYGFKIDYEKAYDSGDKHLILRKTTG